MSALWTIFNQPNHKRQADKYLTMLLLYGFRTATNPQTTQPATFHQISKWLIMDKHFAFATPQYVQERFLTMLEEENDSSGQGLDPHHPMSIYPIYSLEFQRSNDNHYDENIISAADDTRNQLYEWARHHDSESAMTAEEHDEERRLRGAAHAKLGTLGSTLLADRIIGA